MFKTVAGLEFHKGTCLHYSSLCHGALGILLQMDVLPKENCLAPFIKAMSHEAIYRQRVPGNPQEEKNIHISFLYNLLEDSKSLLQTCFLCYRSAVGYLLLPVKIALCDKGLNDHRHAKLRWVDVTAYNY